MTDETFSVCMAPHTGCQVWDREYCRCVEDDWHGDTHRCGCGHTWTDKETDHPMTDNNQIGRLAAEMRANSERWFPDVHDPHQQDMPLDVFYALGLAGEVGELANGIKKLHRDGGTSALGRNIRAEMADVFTYLLLLADHLGVDLVAEYQRKVKVNEQRWGPTR